MKAIFLPRQARDKHRKVEKKGAFFAGRGAAVRADADGKKKNGSSFERFIYQMHHFTKTGSGQTQGKLSKKDYRLSYRRSIARATASFRSDCHSDLHPIKLSPGTSETRPIKPTYQPPSD
jgi:hypothetical protein